MIKKTDAVERAMTALPACPWGPMKYDLEPGRLPTRLLRLGADGKPWVVGVREYAPGMERRYDNGDVNKLLGDRAVWQEAWIVTITSRVSARSATVSFGYLVQMNLDGPELSASGYLDKESAVAAMYQAADAQMIEAIANLIVRNDRITYGMQDSGWVQIQQGTTIADFAYIHAPNLKPAPVIRKEMPGGEYWGRVTFVNQQQVILLATSGLEDDSDSQSPLDEKPGQRPYLISFASPEHKEKICAAHRGTLHFFVHRHDYHSQRTHYSVVGTRRYLTPTLLAKPVALYVPDVEQRRDYLRRLENGDDPETTALMFLDEANRTLDEFSKWNNGENYGVYVDLYDCRGEKLVGYGCFSIGTDNCLDAIAQMSDNLCQNYGKRLLKEVTSAGLAIEEVEETQGEAMVEIALNGIRYTVGVTLDDFFDIKGFRLDQRSNGMCQAIAALAGQNHLIDSFVVMATSSIAKQVVSDWLGKPTPAWVNLLRGDPA